MLSDLISDLRLGAAFTDRSPLRASAQFLHPCALFFRPSLLQNRLAVKEKMHVTVRSDFLTEPAADGVITVHNEEVF